MGSGTSLVSLMFRLRSAGSGDFGLPPSVPQAAPISEPPEYLLDNRLSDVAPQGIPKCVQFRRRWRRITACWIIDINQIQPDWSVSNQFAKRAGVVLCDIHSADAHVRKHNSPMP